MVCDSTKLLADYAYVYFTLPGEKASKTNTKVKDLIDNCSSSLCELKLYPHQLETFNALDKGKNVILTANTGSGKTEAWFIYALKKMKEGNFRVLVVYPTKALANDQTARLYKYMNEFGFDVYSRDNGIYYGDLVRIDGDTSKLKDVKKSIKTAKIFTTNPHMLFFNIFEFPFPNLIVIDELDFYDSGRATSLIELLRYSFPKSQMIIISGTLSNPQDLASTINAEVISGKAFSPEQRYIIVIGKEEKLKKVYDRNRNALSSSYQITSFEDFKNKVFEIYYKSAINGDKELHDDIYESFAKDKAEIEDILKVYKKCENETTIGFFPSIDESNNYGLPLGVPVHHSRVKREERMKIEEGLREGKINYVYTVKTLLQGIDIGTAMRVIHVRMPNLVREFLQREGRKGRREDIPFTESIILPLGFDPRFIKGFETLKAWLSIGPEVIIYNKDNGLVKAFIEAVNLRSGKTNIQGEEKKILELFGIIHENKINQNRLQHFGFYEIESKNYPLKLEDKGNIIDIEKISKKEFVEIYQKGYVDLSNKAIVDDVIYEKGDKPIFIIIERYPYEIRSACIKEAISIYEIILNKWSSEYGEYLPPDIGLDIELGKIISKVIVDIQFNKEGFTTILERPKKVRWYVESRKRLPVEENGTIVKKYLYDKIDLRCTLHGSYKDVTYAYAYEVKDVDIDVGMAFLISVLRISYGIRIDLLNYSYFNGILKVWENQPTGLLEKMRNENFTICREGKCKKLDYDTVVKEIDNVNVNDPVFLSIFYEIFPVEGVDFDKAKNDAKVLASKLFMRAKMYNVNINVNIKGNVIVLDQIKTDIGTEYAMTYNELGGEKVEIYSDEKALAKRLFELIVDENKSQVLIMSEPKPYLNKLSVNVRNVKAEFKDKYKIEIDPADFSEEVRVMMVNSETNDKLFKLRAEIIQGIANFLDKEGDTVKET